MTHAFMQVQMLDVTFGELIRKVDEKMKNGDDRNAFPETE
jgi:hypothetical protein